MADSKISALTAASNLAGTEVVPIVQGGVTKKVTQDQLLKPAATKGVDYSANTPAAGMTSQLLNSYEEGTWTPNQGSGLTVVGAFSSVGKYTKIGRQVTVSGTLTASTSISFPAGGIITGNLPFTSAASGIGSAIRGDIAASAAIITYVNAIYASGAMGVTTNVFFSVTYTV
jgi:hypothetical protein